MTDYGGMIEDGAASLKPTVERDTQGTMEPATTSSWLPSLVELFELKAPVQFPEVRAFEDVRWVSR